MERHPGQKKILSRILPVAAGLVSLLYAASARASEADLVLPDLGSETFLGGASGRTLLTAGMAVCVFGLLFGLYQ